MCYRSVFSWFVLWAFAFFGSPVSANAQQNPVDAHQNPANAQKDPTDPFALDGSDNILDQSHFGIINGKLTTSVNYRDMFAVRGLWAPPYVSNDFHLGVTIAGQSVATSHYVWHPFYVEREGNAQGVAVESITMLIPGTRAGVMEITLHNPDQQSRTVPVAIALGGTLDESHKWEFGAPPSTSPTKAKIVDGTLLLEQGKLAIAVRGGSSLSWTLAPVLGQATVTLPPNDVVKFRLAFAVGPVDEAQKACEQIAADPEKVMAAAHKTYADRVQNIFCKLPRLHTSNPEFDRFYNRSLVHFLMNAWDVPEFVLHPYYSTGSVCGGCVCDYLWNFGENWEIFPLYDQEASRTHIKQFLTVDMTKHFAFEPTTGAAFGPWYMVNQEKILGMIYYHVKNTGDTAFLNEVVDGKTVLEHVIANALYGDDTTKPVALIDYGSSNSHLELRRGLPYNHVMPDLNGRRYENYVMAARLAEVAGKPMPQLDQRAEELKVLLKKSLWNPTTQWFDFQNEKGKKDTRYTVQMFKLFGSKVLDAEEESGLLAHLLNEKEFLSPYGLHSMAKNDPAYDPADVDNGGPGICTGFVPQIAERLYKAGQPAAAESILKRVLWWGQRLPYWGDSIVADKIDYRRDTPLQCTIDGAAVAQGVIFGLFGIQAEFNGDIRIDPRPSSLAAKMDLQNIRLRGHVLDIAIDGSEYEVRDGEHKLRAPIGQAILLRNNQLLHGEAKAE
jgi:hypothetical protein